MDRHLTCLAALVLAVALAGISGCGGGAPEPGSAPGEDRVQLWPGEAELTSERPGCDVLSGPAEPGGTFTVALFDTVDPGRAPVPHNQAERLIFAQLYETLVNVDCDGSVRPGLAERWACTEDSTVWVFTLRQDARLWDGTRITPGEVKEAWSANQDCPRTRTAASPWSWFNARARTVSILDARRLAIRLPEPQASFPLLLAHPATAVALPRQGWTWPVGSGPCRLRATTPAPLPLLECRPNQHHPRPPVWKNLTFDVRPGADPRDAAATGADLLVVRHRDDLAFFQQSPGFFATALPWDRLYLLVVCPQQNTGGGDLWARAARRLDPARDLTTISARSWPEIIFPAGARNDCPQLAGPVAMSGSALRRWNLADLDLAADVLVHPEGDPGAAEIANRLAALADRPVRIAAVPEDAAAFVLDWQMAGAHILRLDQVYPTGCLQMATLLARAAWIQRAGLGEGASAGRELGHNSLAAAEIQPAAPPTDPLTALGAFIHPAALSRPWLVTSGTLAGLRLAFDGTPLLEGLGAAIEPEPVP
jgi:hypothetical protein